MILRCQLIDLIIDLCDFRRASAVHRQVQLVLRLRLNQALQLALAIEEFRRRILAQIGPGFSNEIDQGTRAALVTDKQRFSSKAPARSLAIEIGQNLYAQLVILPDSREVRGAQIGAAHIPPQILDKF